jgi:hypothetical protein
MTARRQDAGDGAAAADDVETATGCGWDEQATSRNPNAASRLMTG